MTLVTSRSGLVFNRDLVLVTVDGSRVNSFDGAEGTPADVCCTVAAATAVMKLPRILGREAFKDRAAAAPEPS